MGQANPLALAEAAAIALDSAAGDAQPEASVRLLREGTGLASASHPSVSTAMAAVAAAALDSAAGDAQPEASVHGSKAGGPAPGAASPSAAAGTEPEARF